METSTLTIRLNKYIAQSGYCSRRQADQLIERGKVLVNSVPTKELGTKIDPSIDEIRIKQGPLIKPPTTKTLLIFYKPRGFACAKKSRESRSLYELLPEEYQNLFTVSNLDEKSEGLMLLTNNGELANQLTHPKFAQEKTYIVTVKGKPDDDDFKRMKKGLYLDEFSVKPKAVKGLSYDPEKDRANLEVTIADGGHRHVEEMFLVLKHPVKRLVRVAFGEFKIGNLRPGEWKVVVNG